MPIRAVAFDIGGVLEITPYTGVAETWEERLHLEPGELNQRLAHVWHDGGLGSITEAQVYASVGKLLGLDQAQRDAFFQDIWDEYLGEPNTELIAYFASLRPRCKTAIISNSFVGAREREQERYHFGDMCDLIVYSHEEGVAKPEWPIFELTWARLGVQPEEMIFLDDVAGHVAAAQELGIHAILFENNVQAIADIERRLQTHA
jgi:putative hydrolase of the HAD superfamily